MDTLSVACASEAGEQLFQASNDVHRSCVLYMGLWENALADQSKPEDHVKAISLAASRVIESAIATMDRVGKVASYVDDQQQPVQKRWGFRVNRSLRRLVNYLNDLANLSTAPIDLRTQILEKHSDPAELFELLKRYCGQLEVAEAWYRSLPENPGVNATVLKMLAESMLSAIKSAKTTNPPATKPERKRRFRPGPCPKCGGRSKVASTPAVVRKFKCEACNHTWDADR